LQSNRHDDSLPVADQACSPKLFSCDELPDTLADSIDLLPKKLPGNVTNSHRIATTTIVNGNASATQSCHCAFSNAAMLKTDDKDVPGKKITVKAAVIFIEISSAFTSRVMVVLVAASFCVARLKIYVYNIN
jgi:hypothetical protein